MKLEQVTDTGNEIIYEGVFAGRIDIQVDVAVDGRGTIDVFANGSKVGTLISHEVVERQEEMDWTFDDSIDAFLQHANVGR